MIVYNIIEQMIIYNSFLERERERRQQRDFEREKEKEQVC